MVSAWSGGLKASMCCRAALRGLAGRRSSCSSISSAGAAADQFVLAMRVPSSLVH